LGQVEPPRAKLYIDRFEFIFEWLHRPQAVQAVCHDWSFAQPPSLLLFPQDDPLDDVSPGQELVKALLSVPPKVLAKLVKLGDRANGLLHNSYPAMLNVPR
jgi:hypothetical protein